MKLKQHIKNLMLLGTSRSKDVRNYSSVYLHNQTLLFIICLTICMSIYYLAMGKWRATLISFFPLSLLATFFYLNAKKKFLLSRVLFLFFANSLITLSVWNLGFKNLTFLHFYNIAILSAILFMDKKPAWMVGSMMISFAYIMFCLLFKDSFFSGLMILNDEQQSYVRTLHVCFHFAMFILIFYSLLRIIEKYHKDELAAESSKIEASKMSALASMSAGIAHEINNPLSIIKLSSQYMKDSANSSTSEHLSLEEVLKFLDRIEAQTDRIGRIVSGMSNFSRTKETDDLIWSPLKNIVDDALVLCKEKIYQNEIKLTASVYDEGLEVWCKPDQLIQVLVNLINNASDAISTRSEKWVRLETQPHGIGEVKISVTDSGEGIDPSIQEKIMNPFFTTKAVGKGTGLGLSVSSSIVRRHGGELVLEQKSLNTRFSFTLKCKSVSKISSKI